jgi:hypothetical protein
MRRFTVLGAAILMASGFVVASTRVSASGADSVVCCGSSADCGEDEKCCWGRSYACSPNDGAGYCVAADYDCSGGVGG